MLFVFSSQDDNSVRMVDETNPESVRTRLVHKRDLRINHNYIPDFYMEGPIKTLLSVPLGNLVKNIRRGTSLTSSDLTILGESAYGTSVWGGFVRGLKSKDIIYYVDNSSLVGDGKVVPKVIAELPPKQERYTLTPDDGMVILITKNGGRSATYTAVHPTLVANNLFIVYPDTDKIDPEYLGYAMRRGETNSCITIKKFVTKADVEAFTIPISSKSAMAKVVEDNKAREQRILKLRCELEELGDIDTLSALEPSAEIEFLDADDE